MNEFENDDALKFSQSACSICFWGQHNKCRHMRNEFEHVQMPDDCSDFDHYPDDWDE